MDLNFHPQMIRAIMDGRKISTTRTKAIGYPGDLFVVVGISGVVFRIVSVSERSLDDISFFHYLDEGFSSPEEFREFWAAIHNGNYRGDRRYRYYYFAPVLESLPVALSAPGPWEVDTRGD